MWRVMAVVVRREGGRSAFYGKGSEEGRVVEEEEREEKRDG